ncbi:MAG: carbohydrate porin [Acetobacteraceae bacterium]
MRTALGNYGISVGLQETSEVLGNVTGGIHRGADYDGLTMLSMGLDTAKAFGWQGGTFNISALQIHGRNLSADNLADLQTASGIEAEGATRLWELWYDQALLDGRMDVKVGQQSIDQEFMVSQYSGTFINTMMGWPAVPSYDLYAGGPAYPLSSLGVRFRGQPTGALTLLGGVFDDNPPGGSFNDNSQLRQRERYGAQFNTTTGALFIAEVQYAVNQPATGDMVTQGAPPAGLPGTYKLGAWFDTAGFPDQRFGSDGLSLADPNSNGNPLLRSHNYSLYGVMDQMIWRPDPQGPRSVGVFARLMGAPGNRNLISFSVNAGVVLKAPLPSRDDDSLGLGFGVVKVSNQAAALDRDTANVSGSPFPVRSSETFIELTYQFQVAPWWQLQPDFQYVFNPGGGVPDPTNPGQRVGNEAILGLRTNITF